MDQHAKTQLPLPEIIAKDLSYENIDFLNERDYLIARNVSPLLEHELYLARMQLNTGANPLFGQCDLLELPIETKTEKGVGTATTQGLREAQEDEHLIFVRPPFLVTALFDGHLGPKCSEFCERHYQKCLEKRLNDEELKHLPEDEYLYNATALSLVDLSRSFSLKEPGCTANVALKIGSDIWIANVGDSRALFVTRDDVIGLSVDARATQERFFMDIVERGGFVTSNFTVAHSLSHWTIAPAQSIGDHHLRGAMNPRPKITRYTVKTPGFLIQACDGLFDVASSFQVGKLVQTHFSKSSVDIAKILTQEALNAGSGDNITTLVSKY